MEPPRTPPPTAGAPLAPTLLLLLLCANKDGAETTGPVDLLGVSGRGGLFRGGSGGKKDGMVPTRGAGHVSLLRARRKRRSHRALAT